jgi:hypothetical protein
MERQTMASERNLAGAEHGTMVTERRDAGKERASSDTISRGNELDRRRGTGKGSGAGSKSV